MPLLSLDIPVELWHSDARLCIDSAPPGVVVRGGYSGGKMQRSLCFLVAPIHLGCNTNWCGRNINQINQFKGSTCAYRRCSGKCSSFKCDSSTEVRKNSTMLTTGHRARILGLCSRVLVQLNSRRAFQQLRQPLFRPCRFCAPGPSRDSFAG